MWLALIAGGTVSLLQAAHVFRTGQRRWFVQSYTGNPMLLTQRLTYGLPHLVIGIAMFALIGEALRRRGVDSVLGWLHNNGPVFAASTMLGLVGLFSILSPQKVRRWLFKRIPEDQRPRSSDAGMRLIGAFFILMWLFTVARL
jgi:hypothetical protein